MNAITRRLFLRSSASASAVAAIGIAPAVADELSQAESPDLLRLDGEMEAAEIALIEAEKAKALARQRFEAMVPAVPEDLIVPPFDTKAGRHWLRFTTELERDCFQEVVPGGRLIVCSHALARHFPDMLDPVRGRMPVYRLEVRRIYNLAREYETAFEAGRALYAKEAWNTADRIRFDMRKMAKQISETPARTIHGVVIKAGAYKRLSRSEQDATFNMGTHYLATDVADSLLAIADRGQS